MSDNPIDPRPDAQSYGAEIIELGDVRVQSGLPRFVTRSCQHRSLTYFQADRRVWCKDCERTIENFDAFMTLVHGFEDMVREARVKMTRAQEAETRVIHRIAAREIEKAWGGRAMAIACPHCRRGILPDDLTGGITCISRDLELARRARSAANS